MMNSAGTSRAPRNRTIILKKEEKQNYLRTLLKVESQISVVDLSNQVVNGDFLEIAHFLPDTFVDLLILDPPYNLTKSFNGRTFAERSLEEYEAWLDSWLPRVVPMLKPTASVYICSDWRSSTAVHRVASKYLSLRNRITWEREKGRGARANWKNCAEDIWYFTRSSDFIFNLDQVKLRRKVLAPYKDANGSPKDWDRTLNGSYRATHPSNIWTDLTVPFWSMKENTDHPTQKPEKLIAKLVLASSRPGDLVLDPFTGSGTSCVVARKLGRRFLGIDIDEDYCCLTKKRLEMAIHSSSIQGYTGGFFWERNSHPANDAVPAGSFQLHLY